MPDTEPRLRIGLIGPAADDEQLGRAVDCLVGERHVTQTVYLGGDDHVERLAAHRRQAVLDDRPGTFLDRAAELAPRGSAAALRALLGADDQAQRLQAVRTVPPPNARSGLHVEMLDDRMVLFAFDRGALTQEDIANADLVIYGRAEECAFERIGPRAFVTPGQLEGGYVAVLEVGEDATLRFEGLTLDGETRLSETLPERAEAPSEP
ncbi:MAG: hypothetical protein KC543_11885 [Myxococcales bacterium]|nr:hypothetical protein [Myxococcales bacterium]